MEEEREKQERIKFKKKMTRDYCYFIILLHTYIQRWKNDIRNIEKLYQYGNKTFFIPLG